MKFSVLKSELSRVIQTAGRFASSKPQTPILSGLKIKALENSLEIAATDYEVGTVLHVPAEVETDGEAVVSGRYFSDIVRALPGDKATVELKDNILSVKSDQSSFSLVSLIAKEFPKIEATSENSFVMNGAALKELARKTSFACSADDTRPVFTGAYFEAKDGVARMVATNVHRLAICEIGASGNASFVGILPKRILDEIQRILPDDDVTVSGTKAEITFKFGDDFISSRLIEGSFPDYRRVLFEDATMKAIMPAREFTDALSRVSLIARSSEYYTVKLKFGNGKVEITSTNPIVGQASDSVSAIYEGEPLEINFNVTYLLDVLKTVNGDKVVLKMNGPLKPAMLTVADEVGFKYIATPVRAKA